MSKLERLLTQAAQRWLARLPDDALQAALVALINARMAQRDPADRLRFLLSLDNTLYGIQAAASVAYGGGTHTKHRHTRYHDFFVGRINADEHVLDIGCGTGAVAFDVASKAGAHVLGVDLNADWLAIARERFAHPNVTYLHGDVLKNLPEQRFDVAILSNVLEHLPGRPDFLRRVVEASGVGRILIRVPVFERDWRVPLKQEVGVEWRLDGTHETEYTLESFAAEMAEARMTVTHQEVRWGEIWAEVRPA